jgi:hypothetical protein
MLVHAEIMDLSRDITFIDPFGLLPLNAQAEEVNQWLGERAARIVVISPLSKSFRVLTASRTELPFRNGNGELLVYSERGFEN